MTQKIDFFARQRHFVDHLLPVWLCLPEYARGTFYIHQDISAYADEKGLNYTPLAPAIQGSLRVKVPGTNPVYVCAYGDFLCIRREDPRRVVILAEHGIGLAFGENAGYAGGTGMRSQVDYFFSTNQFVAEKNKRVYDTPVDVIGVPKMDFYHVNKKEQEMPKEPTICISFHWNGSHIAPEAGNAFSYFGREEILLELKERYNLIAHCHPKARDEMIPVFRKVGIPFVELEEVFEQADILVNDSSSIAYEFCVTGKPVILMNSIAFRREVNWGIRFWEYSDIGRNVSTKRQLFEAIEATIRNPKEFKSQREKMVRDLYPNLGSSAGLAARYLVYILSGEEAMETLETKDHELLMNMPYGTTGSTRGFTDIEIKHLCWLGANAPEDTIFLDIGRNEGKSASAIASGLLHSQRNAKVFTLETFENSINNPLQIVHFNRMLSYEVHKMKQAYQDNANIGLLFLNGNIEQDFRLWSKYLVSGAYVSIHKYGFAYPETEEAIEKVFPQDEFELPTVTGRIWTARKK